MLLFLHVPPPTSRKSTQIVHNSVLLYCFHCTVVPPHILRE